jgi:uncharacterized membrane protein (UPF0127 family)
MRATDAMRFTNSTILRITSWLQERYPEILAFDNAWSGSQDPRWSVQNPARTKDSSAPTDVAEEEYLQAVNVTKDSLVASRVSLAITSEERRRGLLGRRQMDSDEGLYIVPTQWIHMFGMQFPIDVAFLSSSGRVLWVHHHIKPNRLSRLVWRAEGALELPAGALQASGTEVGDTIELRASTPETKSRRVF